MGQSQYIWFCYMKLGILYSVHASSDTMIHMKYKIWIGQSVIYFTGICIARIVSLQNESLFRNKTIKKKKKNERKPEAMCHNKKNNKWIEVQHGIKSWLFEHRKLCTNLPSKQHGRFLLAMWTPRLSS